MTGEVKLLEAHIVGGSVQARFAFDHIGEMVKCFKEICDEHGAQNYLELQMADKEGNEFIVTVQRGGKPTPHMLRQKAEAVVEALRADAERYRWLRDPPLDANLPAWIAGRGNEHIESDWLTGIHADAAIDEAMRGGHGG